MKNWQESTKTFKTQFVEKRILPKIDPALKKEEKPEKLIHLERLEELKKGKEVSGMGWNRIKLKGDSAEKSKGKKKSSKKATPVAKRKTVATKAKVTKQPEVENTEKAKTPKGKKAIMARRMELLRELAQLKKAEGGKSKAKK